MARPCPTAIEALDRVASDSELRDLWSEAEDDDWATGLTELRQRIVDGIAGDLGSVR